MLFVRGVTLPQAYQSYVACLKSYRGISKTYQRAPWIRLVVFKAECLKCFLGWEKCKSYWCIQRRKRKRRCKVGEIHRITFNSGRKNKIDWLHWWLGTRFHQVMLNLTLWARAARVALRYRGHCQPHPLNSSSKQVVTSYWFGWSKVWETQVDSPDLWW